jgi:hypothetical protein
MRGRAQEVRYATDDRESLRVAVRDVLTADYGQAPSAATVDQVIDKVVDFMRFGDTDGDFFSSEE